MSRSPILAKVEAYYTSKLGKHGPTPPGVDWNSAESQRLRFEQLLRLCDVTRPFSLIDYGCGYGALLDHLVEGGIPASYVGFDVSPAMIDVARALHPCGGVFLAEEADLMPADYAVGSGIFNVRLDIPEPEWEAYVLGTLERLAALGRRGFAFNVLTQYSDPPRRRADLYYADPLFFFDHCKRRFSPRVALLHDYPLYEFTILVRRDDPA